MHEGALLLVGGSAKGFCRMRCFDSYCHVLTSGILVFLCMVENRENLSIMSRMLLLSEYFAVIFFKRRNYN